MDGKTRSIKNDGGEIEGAGRWRRETGGEQTGENFQKVADQQIICRQFGFFKQDKRSRCSCDTLGVNQRFTANKGDLVYCWWGSGSLDSGLSETFNVCRCRNMFSEVLFGNRRWGTRVARSSASVPGLRSAVSGNMRKLLCHQVVSTEAGIIILKCEPRSAAHVTCHFPEK